MIERCPLCVKKMTKRRWTITLTGGLLCGKCVIKYQIDVCSRHTNYEAGRAVAYLYERSEDEKPRGYRLI